MTGKGIVIEFDFAAMNGAELLFKTTKKFLRDLDRIPFDESLEARCLAGRTYADGLARLFAQAKTKKTAPKAARELSAAFASAVTGVVPTAVGIPFLRTAQRRLLVALTACVKKRPAVPCDVTGRCYAWRRLQ